jgi:hypothetical protein
MSKKCERWMSKECEVWMSKEREVGEQGTRRMMKHQGQASEEREK